MKRTLSIVACLTLAGAAASQEIGPAQGSVFVVGGGMRDQKIVQRFLELAGGADAPIVVIPTAGEEETYSEDWAGLRQFKQAGATRLKVLHTRDRKVADTDAFAAPIREARGVFFAGGRHWRLADSYLNTKTHAELHALLQRGGVIGGTSAGATILGSFMVRGDTKGNTIMVGDHVEGLGFLKNVTIDQHLLRRNRQFDLLTVIEARPDLLGIGIDEDTAIVVRGDAFEVIGNGYVAIYDNTRRLDTGGRFYFLAPGDRYDMKTRDPKRPEARGSPLERVVKEPWPKK